MEGQPSAVPQPLAAPASLRPMPSLDLTPEKETAPPFLKSHATFLNNKSKALQELNVPRHISRYNHLQQIDLSDTSFEELLVKPNGVKRPTTHTKTKSNSHLLPKLNPKEEAIIREQPYWEKLELQNKPCPLLTPPTLYHDVMAADNNI